MSQLSKMIFHKKGINTVYKAYIINFASMFIDFVFFTYIFRKLTIQDAGIYSWAIAVVAFISLFIDLGINQLLIREFSKKGNITDLIKLSFKIRIPFILLGISLFILWALNQSSVNQTHYVLLLLSGVQVISVYEASYASYLRAFEKQDEANMFNLSNTILKACFGLLVMFVLKLPYILPLSAGLFIAKCINFNIVYFSFRKIRKNLRYLEIDNSPLNNTQFIKSAISFFIISALTIIQTRGDWLLVTKLLNKTALASYAISNKFYEIAISLCGILLITTYPWHCRLINMQRFDDIKYNIFIKFYLLISLFGGFLICTFSEYFINGFFSQKYSNAIIPLRILGITFIFSSINGLLYQLLVARGKEALISKITIIFVVVQIATDLIMIPKFNISGAALGMLIHYFTATLLLFFILSRYNLYPKTMHKTIYFPFLFAIITLILIQVVPSFYIKSLFFIITLTLATSLIFHDPSERLFIKSIII